MFFKRETFTIIGQLLIILFLALWVSTTSIIPLNASGVEGFHPMYPAPLEYTNVGDPNKATDDLHKLRAIVPQDTQCKKVGGFNGFGVFCTPYTQPESIDIYSKARGDITCESMGLYNSKSPLCLDENMKRMLQTRGENAAGGFGQIGSP